MKKLFCILVFLSSLFVLSAQDKDSGNKLNFNINIGGASAILDKSLGFHIEVVPGYRISNYFDVIGQLSYTTLVVERRFLFGGPGYDYNTNILLGGRYYFLPPEESIRIYANLLVGIAYGVEETTRGIELESKNTMTYGTSLGLYIKHRSNVSAGIALESFGTYILKIGYHF